MPYINEMLLKFECFQYFNLLVLNMVYYYIQLSNNASNLFMIILPWGGYGYKQLTMGIENSPDIFHQKMNDLFHWFGFTHYYLRKNLVITKGNWKDHIHKLKLTLSILNGKGLKFNIERSFFGQTKLEYLGFVSTHDGIKPINKKTNQQKIWCHRLSGKNYIRL